jgi:predicted enzyme related to lactoylglutathione lyase
MRPNPRFAAALRARIERELQMPTTTTQLTEIRVGEVNGIHVRVNNIDRAFEFVHQLFGWEAEPYRDGAATSYYVRNTRILTVLVAGSSAPPIRLYFAPDDVGRAADRLVELGGRVLSDVTDDHLAEAEDNQGIPVGLWRPAPEYRDRAGTPTPAGEAGQISIEVPDRARAVEFYSRLLGWTYDEPFPDYPHAREAGVAVGIRQSPEGPSVGVAWRVESVEAMAARARSLGAEVGAIATFPAGSGAECSDQDGNTYYLWQAAPGH